MTGFLALGTALVLFLAMVGVGQTAQFSYCGGGFHSQSEAHLNTYHNGPYADWDAASAASSAEVPGVDQSTRGEGAGNFVLIDSQSVDIQVTGKAEGKFFGQSTDHGSGWAYGNANTVHPGVTNGFFLRLGPTGIEQVGDWVRVLYSWWAESYTFLGGQASITGGFADHLAITRNDFPAPSGPDPLKEVWTHPKISIGENDFFTDDDQGEFLAQVGDIIGVHLGAGARIDFWDAIGSDNLTFEAVSKNRLHLEVAAIPVPATLWLLGSGLAGLAAWSRWRFSGT
jgi:hypothetical protein